MGVDKRKMKYSSYDVTINGIPAESAIVSTRFGDVLPSSPDLAGAGVELIGAADREHQLKELLVCYLAESREGQTLDLHYDLGDADCVQVDAYRQDGEENHRVFSARMLYA